MRRHRKQDSGDAVIDLTPMIDVVFQLIIFFIVAIHIQKEFDPDIFLPDAPRGPEITGEDPRTFIVEVNRRGWISMHGVQFSKGKLRKILQGRFNRFGEFPVLIRGDGRAKHQDIRAVMDICTEVGIWRVSFVAIKEKKT